MKKIRGCITQSIENQHWLNPVLKMACFIKLITIMDFCDIRSDSDDSLVGHLLIVDGPVKLIKFLEKATQCKGPNIKEVVIRTDSEGKISQLGEP